MFAGCYVPFITLPLVWCRLAHFLDLDLVERIKFTTHINIKGDDNYQCVINYVQTTRNYRVFSWTMSLVHHSTKTLSLV